MSRRSVLAILAAGLALLVTLELLLLSLYREERRVLAGALDDRLGALGRSAARWLEQPGADAALLLRALVDENRLEDAYLLDGNWRVEAAARTPAGERLNLLRLDRQRAEAALAGTASVARGYVVDDVAIESGYFPVGGRRVLGLEAGVDYLAPVDRLALVYGAAAALALVLAGLFSSWLWLAARALERARLAHGRAERLAAVGQMAAMVAHEVRNPLGILRGGLELLRERLGPEAPARERERIGDLLDEIERMNLLTEEFLGLARDAPLELGAVDLGALVADLMAAARLSPAAAGVHLEARVSQGLTIVADEARLRRALLNLILNAAQAGGEGTTVTVGAELADGEARLTVRDAGPGVPAELRERLFDPFVSGRRGGSGLGLTVAQRIAEQHGGRLSLEPPPDGRGACFLLTLPSRTAWPAS